MRVNRKKTNTIATQISDTPITPRSCTLTITPPMFSTFSGNGLCRNFTSGAQIQPASPLRMISSAIVAITTVSSPERDRGLIRTL